MIWWSINLILVFRVIITCFVIEIIKVTWSRTWGTAMGQASGDVGHWYLCSFEGKAPNIKMKRSMCETSIHNNLLSLQRWIPLLQALALSYIFCKRCITKHTGIYSYRQTNVQNSAARNHRHIHTRLLIMWLYYSSQCNHLVRMGAESLIHRIQTL